jgi:hypothetical protein
MRKTIDGRIQKGRCTLSVRAGMPVLEQEVRNRLDDYTGYSKSGLVGEESAGSPRIILLNTRTD